MNALKSLSLPQKPPSPLGTVFSILGAALPLVALFNSKAIVPLGVVAAIALLGIAYRQGQLGRLFTLDRMVTIGLGGLLLFAVVASVASGVWPDSLRSLAKLFGMVALGIVIFCWRDDLTDNDVTWVTYGVVAGPVLAMTLIVSYVLFERAMLFAGFRPERYNEAYFYALSLYGYFWLKSATTVMAVASLIAGTALNRRNRPIAAICLIAAAALVCAWVGSRTAGLGLVAALAAAMLYQAAGRYRLKLTLSALALAFLLPVWLAAADFKPEQVSSHLDPADSGANSIVYRMHIWGFVTDKIVERPALGWGAGASKRIGNDDVGQVLDPRFGKLGEPIPVHPHNAVLQVWLEFGGFGALFAFLLVARWITLAERHVHGKRQRIGAFSVGTLIACFFGFNYSISSSWWLVAVIISLVVTTIVTRTEPAPPATN